jgi:dihydroflavonol-4-reductase
MKVLITGATGFIGRHLLASLINQPATELFVLVRNRQKLEPSLLPAVSLLEGNLLALPPLPPGLDVVFHLAGLTKAAKATDYYNVNQQGTASLLKALDGQSKKIKFIYLSSLAAVGPAAKARAAREDDPPQPINPYGRSKLLGEKEVLGYQSRLNVVIIRVGGVYGPGDRDFLTFFRFINRGLLPIFDSGRMRMSLCYVQDLVNFLLLAARKDLNSGEIFHLADANFYTWEQVGQTAARLLGKKTLKIKAPSWLVFFIAAVSQGFSRLTNKPSVINLDKYKEMKAAFWTADASKAQRVLGFQPQYDLEKGLAETLSWYQQKGWL